MDERLNAWTRDEPWVFGVELGLLVLAPESFARARLRDLELIGSAKTYVEARRLQLQTTHAPGTDEEWNETPDSEPYDPAAFEDWPPRLATAALDHWPEDLEDIGEERDAFPGNPVLGVDPAQEAQIVAALTKCGYRIRRDDELLAELELYL